MTPIKIKVTDFEYGSNPEANFLLGFLRERYEIEFSEDPDFLIYSVWGKEHCNYDCVKIFYTGEPVAPDFNECDYAIGFDDISFDDRYMRLPLFAMQLTREIQDRERFRNTELNKRRFCNFVYNNETVGRGALLRKDFCKKLMGYKEVDCPGAVLHNMQSDILSSRFSGMWYRSKLDFIRNYKFTIAFENSLINGYTTEKLIQPLMAGSIPVYFGNAQVAKDFNPNAFINAADFGNDFDAVIERVREIDADDRKAMDMILCPPMVNDHWFGWRGRLQCFLDNIIKKGPVPFEKFRTEKTEMNTGGLNGTNNFKLYGTAILDEIKRYKGVYIYGDGLFGCRLSELLRKKDIFSNIIGFTVTDSKRSGEFLMGKPIVPIKTIPVNDETLLLIAIREEAQPELISELGKAGWKNLLSVNPLLFDILENMQPDAADGN